MGILSFLKRRRNARYAARAAKEVAERSYAAVLGRVRRRATTMRTAEARGYVRSRSLEIVHRELAAVHNGHIKLDPAIQTEIISQATEAVVVRVLAELRSVPKAGKPDRRQAA
jgi:hypothetical protein